MSWFDRLASTPLWARISGMALSLGLLALASSYRSQGGDPIFHLSYLFNLGHAPLYGLLASQIVLLLGPGAARRPIAWVSTLTAIFVLGWLDEWHQSTIAGRDSSLLDMVTDGFGAVTALCLARWASREALDWRQGAQIVLIAATLTLLWTFIPTTNTAAWPLPLLGSSSAAP